ncbi:MAG TPA: hypothetical protein VF185_01645 [Patescibacteria group bacterium]
MYKKVVYNNTSGAIYGLGFVGALIFEIQHSITIGDMIMGILKSIVWPALVTFRVFEYFRI